MNVDFVRITGTQFLCKGPDTSIDLILEVIILYMDIDIERPLRVLDCRERTFFKGDCKMVPHTFFGSTL